MIKVNIFKNQGSKRFVFKTRFFKDVEAAEDFEQEFNLDEDNNFDGYYLEAEIEYPVSQVVSSRVFYQKFAGDVYD